MCRPPPWDLPPQKALHGPRPPPPRGGCRAARSAVPAMRCPGQVWWLRQSHPCAVSANKVGARLVERQPLALDRSLCRCLLPTSPQLRSQYWQPRAAPRGPLDPAAQGARQRLRGHHGVPTAHHGNAPSPCGPWLPTPCHPHQTTITSNPQPLVSCLTWHRLPKQAPSPAASVRGRATLAANAALHSVRLRPLQVELHGHHRCSHARGSRHLIGMCLAHYKSRRCPSRTLNSGTSACRK
mmetsp:Transcript_64014/g.187295  ORF Transcript_64014/g.187295 Transcript_64014/m.187295 type:complete len:239 (-) Transcript_64014:73-789(-)